jgi:hypothetical protein
MNPDPDRQQRIGTPVPRTAFTRTTEHYVWAVLGYFVLSIVTKTFLTWTMATLYFVLVLDVVPRIIGWIRRAASDGVRR